jgi:hypothetical protein
MIPLRLSLNLHHLFADLVIKIDLFSVKELRKHYNRFHRRLTRVGTRHVTQHSELETRYDEFYDTETQLMHPEFLTNLAPWLTYFTFFLAVTGSYEIYSSEDCSIKLITAVICRFL